MARGNADRGPSSQLPSAISELNPSHFQPHSHRSSAGVRFAEPHSLPRSASRGHSRTRRTASRSNSKGALEHSIPPLNRGKSHVTGVDTADLGPGTSVPAPPKSLARRPPAARGNADQLPPQKSWAAIAKSATKGYSLSYLPPAAVGNKMRVTISADILQASNPKWDECLVGYLIGKKLPFKLVEAAMKHIWGAQLVDTMANDDGFFFFHIPDSAFRKEILESGPLTIAKVPLVLQQWHSLINLEKKKHEAVPIWIKLRNIPFALWSAIGISAVASAVGKPLYVDSQTEKMRMLSYVRVCVEIQAGVGLPDVIEVDMMEDIRMIKVEYEWRPSYCPSCICFGHKCPVVNTEHQNSPVLSLPRAESPGQLNPQQQPPDETWTEVSSRRKNPLQQPVAPTRPGSIQKPVAPPSQNRGQLSSSPPQAAHACFSVLEQDQDAESEENDSQPSEEDLEEPQVVKSSLPPEDDVPLLEPECPEADIPLLEPLAPARTTRKSSHSNIQVLGLPSSSNLDSKLGDPPVKHPVKHVPLARISSSVSEENESFHDEAAVDSQEQIAMVSLPPTMAPIEGAALHNQARGTRSSKGSRIARPPQPGPQPGGTTNPPLPQHSSKSSKSRKSGR